MNAAGPALNYGRSAPIPLRTLPGRPAAHEGPSALLLVRILGSHAELHGGPIRFADDSRVAPATTPFQPRLRGEVRNEKKNRNESDQTTGGPNNRVLKIHGCYPVKAARFVKRDEARRCLSRTKSPRCAHDRGGSV